MVCLDPAAVADAWAGRVEDHWAGHCRELCRERGHDFHPWALGAVLGPEAVRRELLNQPQDGLLHLWRQVVADEPEQGPPAAWDVGQLAVLA